MTFGKTTWNSFGTIGGFIIGVRKFSFVSFKIEFRKFSL